jgi:hypothetical protein
MDWLNIQHIESSAERYKINIIQCNPALVCSCINEIKDEGYPVIDIGFELANFIATLSSRRYLSLDVHDFFQKLICKYAVPTGTNSRSTVILHNIGILLEPDLRLNVNYLLAEAAKIYNVVLVWEGTVHNERILFWTDEKNHFTINLSHLPVKFQKYEI